MCFPDHRNYSLMDIHTAHHWFHSRRQVPKNRSTSSSRAFISYVLLGSYWLSLLLHSFSFISFILLMCILFSFFIFLFLVFFLFYFLWINVWDRICFGKVMTLGTIINKRITIRFHILESTIKGIFLLTSGTIIFMNIIPSSVNQNDLRESHRSASL